MTNKFDNVYVEYSYTIASIYEGNGPISKYFNKVYNKDFYFGEKTIEAAESKILSDTLDGILRHDKRIDLIISGDLQNQLAASDYGMRDKKIPFLGIYNACATFGEGINIASNFIDGGKFKKIIVASSSHNMVAEKQFRNPTEYGAPKKKTCTFTATGAGAILLTNKKTNIMVKSATIGSVMDAGIKDINNMGAVMAIAAGDTIYKHLTNLGIDASYYDLILTGDLGIYGKQILIDYLKKKGIDLSKNYNDCGLILYDINRQNVYAGASGPACSALVTCSYVLSEMKKGTYKKVLIISTGAIFSPTRVFQKDSIPSIAHAFSLEVC